MFYILWYRLTHWGKGPTVNENIDEYMELTDKMPLSKDLMEERALVESWREE